MMTTNVPQGAPGSLKAAEYVAMMDYVLEQNRFPVGGTPLTEAKLKSLTFVSPPN
jgi:hypothetical protein